MFLVFYYRMFSIFNQGDSHCIYDKVTLNTIATDADGTLLLATQFDLQHCYCYMIF